MSAVFYRSVEEHCTKMSDIKNSVLLLHTIHERDRRLSNMRKLLMTREKLLVEVGRMVRLGRLLKTRLRDPFILDEREDG